MKKMNIALDGPAGAGKSTVARMVASRLGYVYVDTGAMYRAVTWQVLRLGVDLADKDEIARIAEHTEIELKPGAEGQTVLVGGVDVTDQIRTPAINQAVSSIAAIPRVRDILVRKQKQMAAAKGVVMDGRDIGTKVMPDAEVKVFLDASPRVRALRRLAEMDAPDITLEQLEEELRRRDTMDRERSVSPLTQAPDAVYLDTTHMSLDEVVDYVLKLCKKIDEGS